MRAFHFKIEYLMLAGQRANVGYHKIGCKIVASRAVPLFPAVHTVTLNPPGDPRGKI